MLPKAHVPCEGIIASEKHRNNEADLRRPESGTSNSHDM